MSISIQTNVNSLVAQQNLNVNNKFQSKTIEQLTSGYRINSSGDDAAGLAVANKFRNNIAEITQGVANGNDSVAQLQIMDGGMTNIGSILDRLKTLAAQSASGSFTGDRTVLNKEFQTDLGEIDRQAQAIGLNTGGSFAKSLAVYLGGGSGTTAAATLNNGTVTVDLSKSTVDSQSLGLKGLQVVNASASTGLVTKDIGTNSATGTSVQAIVGNNSNQEALAGYASFQFSAPGFADAGKIGISVNLTGVSDTASLATAVNNAIQGAGTGGTAAANAFKSAAITASVYTDSTGAQALAFNSSNTAFQVQAGDQMANALMGNVSNGTALGTAVTSSVSGSDVTTGGTGFTTPQNVHLVVSGGGLAQAQDLRLNAASNTTTAAISDLLNQFRSNTALVSAGLSMANSAGGSALGGNLQFTSATGQAFNVAVTGDTQNMLGLGSFLTDTSGSADYTKITAGSGYSAAAVTGVLGTTAGAASGLEISLDGATSQAVTPIDLTTGAHASAASVTGIAVSGGAADITATNNALDISVVNNGVTTNWAGTLSTNTVAASGQVASSTITAASSVVVDATHNKFQLSVDGGPGVEVTVTGGTYTGGTQLIDAINAGIRGTSLGSTVTAGWDATNGGKLTFTSASSGAGSSVAISNASTLNTVNTSGAVASSTITAASSVAVDDNHNKFQLAVDGGPMVDVTVTNGTYTGGTQLIDAINAGIRGTSLGSTVTAGWDATNGGKLTFTSASTGAGSSVAIGNSATTNTVNISGAVASSTVTASSSVAVDDNHNKFQLAVDGGPMVEVTVNNGTYTGGTQLIDAINAGIRGTSLGSTVTAGWDATNGGKLTFTSASTGAGSSVAIGNSATTNTVNISGAVASSTITASSSVAVDDNHNKFQLAVDGGPEVEVTVTNGTYTGGTQLIDAINAGIRGTSLGSTVTAGWDATNGGKLTFTSASTGAGSSVAISNSATTNTVTSSASVASGSITSADSVLVDNTHDTFQLAVDGGASVAINVAHDTYTGGTDLVDAINTAISHTSLNGLVHASFDGTNGGKLTFTAASTGAGSAVAVSNGATNDLLSTDTGSELDLTDGDHNSGLTTQVSNDLLSTTSGKKLDMTDGDHNSGSTTQVSNDLLSTTSGKKLDMTDGDHNSGSTTQVSNDLLSTTSGKKLDIATGSHNSGTTVQTASDLLSTTAGKKLDIASGSHNSGTADAPATLDSIAAQIQGHFVGTAVVTVTNSSQINIASVTKGANSEVLVNTPTTNGANTALGLTGAATTTPGQNSSIDDVVSNLNAQFTNNSTWQSAGLNAFRTLSDGTANAGGTYISIGSSNGTQFRLNALGSGATTAEDIGFGTAGSTFTGGTPNASTHMASLDAYGTSATGATTFNAIVDGNEQQVLTFSANDSTGALQTKSITLQNNATSRAGRSIDDAVAYINQQLQSATTYPALQSIVAVKEKVGSAEKINFVSTLSSFSVGVGGTGGTDGLNAGTPGTLQSGSNGASANMAIDTQAGAQAAVTAITAAVAKLGSAQAAIGKGQNQLGYAISLAQSQISNFSAAQAQIRDTDVAQQAANLTKAQVLQQASIAAMAQANSAPQAVLSLLKG